LLNIENTALALIDVQGKLAEIVHDHAKTLKHIGHFIKAAESFSIPILWSEQAPDKIGGTVDFIKKLLPSNIKPIRKRSFSCYGSPEYVKQLRSIKRHQILLTGIETHVCVYQTARDLKLHGYEVFLIADAVSARHEFDHQMAITRMRDEGITITTTEMVMCELLKSADHLEFKKIIVHLKSR
jgi:nicotinamidase-related amidase